MENNHPHCTRCGKSMSRETAYKLYRQYSEELCQLFAQDECDFNRLQHLLKVIGALDAQFGFIKESGA